MNGHVSEQLAANFPWKQGPARVGTDCATELLVSVTVSDSPYGVSTPWRQRTQKRNCAHRVMLVNRSQVCAIS